VLKLHRRRHIIINTQQLEYLIKLALFSSYVENERPVSLLISAKVESGKTEILKKAIICKGVLYINDLTAYGIQHKYLDDICNGKIRTIIIPDLIVPLSRQHDTVQTLISFLNSLIEEGVAKISTYLTSIELKYPVRCNIITSIAKEHLTDDRRYRWAKVGFLSRVIPVTYEYGPSTIYQIMRSIALREYQHDTGFNDLKFPSQDVKIYLPEELATQIQGLVPHIRKAEELYGFRLQKQIQTLCMANALMAGRDIVEDIDFAIVSKLADYINFNYKQI